MKKKIDIEKLLQWAIREELPKGRPVSADIGFVIGRRHSRRPFSVAMSAGVLPDIDSFGFVPGSPHEDALVIADAVGDIATDARIATEDDALRIFGEFAPIAGAGLQSLMKAVFNQQALVISRAIAGQRPPWEFEMATPHQTRITFRDAVGSLRERPLVEGLDDDGDLVAMTPNRGRAAMKNGLYTASKAPRSPLHWSDPSPLHVGHARAEYFAWHAALCSLAVTLGESLAEFEPLLPAAQPLPWITGQTAAPRVLPDNLPLGLMTHKLPLQPKRRAPKPPLMSDIKSKSQPRPGVLKQARARKAELAGVS